MGEERDLISNPFYYMILCMYVCISEMCIIDIHNHRNHGYNARALRALGAVGYETFTSSRIQMIIFLLSENIITFSKSKYYIER